MRLLVAAHHGGIVREPEGSWKKDAFTRRQPVDAAVFLNVAHHKPVPHQLALDGIDGADDARIVYRQEAEQRYHEQRGIECASTIILHEGVALWVEPVAAYVGVNRCSQRAPSRHRPPPPIALP